eukprot:6214366-Pleurochrysis_carterae.AAC.1
MGLKEPRPGGPLRPPSLTVSGPLPAYVAACGGGTRAVAPLIRSAVLNLEGRGMRPPSRGGRYDDPRERAHSPPSMIFLRIQSISMNGEEYDSEKLHPSALLYVRAI